MIISSKLNWLYLFTITTLLIVLLVANLFSFFGLTADFYFRNPALIEASTYVVKIAAQFVFFPFVLFPSLYLSFCESFGGFFIDLPCLRFHNIVAILLTFMGLVFLYYKLVGYVSYATRRKGKFIFLVVISALMLGIFARWIYISSRLNGTIPDGVGSRSVYVNIELQTSFHNYNNSERAARFLGFQNYRLVGFREPYIPRGELFGGFGGRASFIARIDASEKLRILDMPNLLPTLLGGAGELNARQSQFTSSYF